MNKPLRHPEYGKPGGPPSPNPHWHQGEDGQWRLPKAHDPNWSREGQHGVLGVLIGALPFAGYALGDDGLRLITLVSAVVCMVVFIVYEIVEGWRLRDWAYRDIGGYMGGAIAATVVCFMTLVGLRLAGFSFPVS